MLDPKTDAIEMPEGEIETEMHIGNARCAASRYRGFRILPGDVLEVFFDSPREVVRVEGQDDVEYARQEIQDVLDPPDRPGMWEQM